MNNPAMPKDTPAFAKSSACSPRPLAEVPPLPGSCKECVTSKMIG